MIPPSRVRALNDDPVRPGGYVLYWMQQSQRARFNHALEYAAERANELGQPLAVAFGLTDGYPDANERHYTFMLEGLRDAGSEGRKAGDEKRDEEEADAAKHDLQSGRRELARGVRTRLHARIVRHRRK